MNAILIALISLLANFCFAQSPLKFSFEKLDTKHLPQNWDLTFSEGGASGYNVTLDSTIKYEGKYPINK